MVSKDSDNMTQSPVKPSSLSIKTSSTYESSEKASQRTTATLQKIKKTKCSRQRRVLILAVIAVLLGLIVIGLVTHTAIKASTANKLKASGREPVTDKGAGENVSGDTIKKGEDLSDIVAKHGASGASPSEKSPISDPTAVQETKGKSLSYEQSKGSYWPSFKFSQKKLGYALSAVVLAGVFGYMIKDCFGSPTAGTLPVFSGTDMKTVADNGPVPDFQPRVPRQAASTSTTGQVAVVEVWPRNVVPGPYTYTPNDTMWWGNYDATTKQVAESMIDPNLLASSGDPLSTIGREQNISFSGDYKRFTNTVGRIRAGGSTEIIDVLKAKWGDNACLSGAGFAPAHINAGMMNATIENGWAVQRIGPEDYTEWNRPQCPIKKEGMNYSRVMPYDEEAMPCYPWVGPILFFKVFNMI